MTQNCLDVMHQYGEYPDGNDLQAMEIPEVSVDVCAGDFLYSTTADSRLHAKKISSLAWTTDLATTRVAAKAAFVGVALGEFDSGTCHDAQIDIPIAKYRAGSKFTRSYEIYNDAGAATPTTWVRGLGFTFAKNPSSNALLNDKIVKTSTAGHIVFRAVKDSGPSDQARAEVEFAS